MNTPTENTPIIAAYTRAQALEDGEQIDVNATAAEAGFKFPVFITRAAYGLAIVAGGKWEADPITGGEILKLPAGQDANGRLWDVLNVLLWAIRAASAGEDILQFAVSVYAYDGGDHRHDVQLFSQCGPRDIDDPAPALTIMTAEDM